MSYMDIDNLYKNQEILMFKKCYALEKIHGTSAHISFGPEHTHFFSGGEKNENFIKLFDPHNLREKFKEIGVPEMIIYGEAYGGKCQGMSATYGKELKFVAFEVRMGDNWLSVPQADEICKELGIDFVHYEEVDTNVELLDKLCAADSVQAIRNGMGEGHLREGIVLRPLIELRKNNGERIIAKHKNDTFKEREHVPKVRPDNLEVMTEASKIADEWTTDMRLTHVLDKFPDADITQTGEIIKAMIEDVIKESKEEIVDNKLVRGAIGKKAAELFKQRLKSRLK
jgi:RNA ligase